jgi:hypothetical protein
VRGEQKAGIQHKEGKCQTFLKENAKLSLHSPSSKKCCGKANKLGARGGAKTRLELGGETIRAKNLEVTSGEVSGDRVAGRFLYFFFFLFFFLYFCFRFFFFFFFFFFIFF